MEATWLNQIKRLQALSATGLAYSRDQYDQERFEQINLITAQMLAQLSSTPLERIIELSPDSKSYPTPKVDVRAAVIRDDQILLVQERDNELWTMPGGFAEVGLSAAENVAKEVLEEACIAVTAEALYSVRHKAKGPFKPDIRDFYKLYFLCDRIDDAAPQPGAETLAVKFFSIDALPTLCTDRVVLEDIERAFEFRTGAHQQTWFD